MPTCSECGYLAMSNATTNSLDGADSRLRTTGNRPSNYFDNRPLCLVRCASFASKMDTTPQAILAAITSEIDCHEFTEWFQGFSPKEHLEMNFFEVARRRDEDRAEADRLWREMQANQDREWKESQSARERVWRSEDRSLSFTTLIAGALISFLSLVGGLIGAKFLPWFNQP